MSRRPANNAAGVSLFPFLAVLVCTMGSLILLLLVTTKRIRAAAIEKARQTVVPEETPTSEPPPIVVASEPEPEDDPAAEWQSQIEQLTTDRDVLRGRLSKLQGQADTTQSAMMRTKVKAASAADRLNDIRTQQEQTAAERKRLQAEIDSLQSDLTDAELRLSKATEKQQTANSKFAFLPFDGRTGTTKRPILIECTQDYIRFLPEDVRLTPAELNGFTPGFNPLLIASRELVHYWKAYERVHAPNADKTKDADSFETDLAALNDKEREPYVLLLVRPNGAVAFHIAKGFLSVLKVPNGYELITDDMELDTANPDPDAKQICQTAIAQVLAEREKLVQALARNRDQQRDQLQLEPSARTFVTKETADPGSEWTRPKTASRPSGNGAERNGQPNADVRGTGSKGTPQTGGAAPPGGQREFAARPPGASTGRFQSGEEPNEERLPEMKSTGRSKSGEESGEEPPPEMKTRRSENDDTKPFPLTRGEPMKGAPAGKFGAPVSPKSNAKPNDSQSPASPNADPRAANKSSGGSNLAKMKRRYLMPRGGIGLEKAIAIRIRSNRVVVGGNFEIPIDASIRTESLVDRVVLAMDRVQSGWPSAGEGYHWVPTIKYEVVPGGEQVHQRLNSALFDLGLVSNVEYLTTDPDASKSSRETSRLRATPGGTP